MWRQKNKFNSVYFDLHVISMFTFYVVNLCLKCLYETYIVSRYYYWFWCDVDLKVTCQVFLFQNALTFQSMSHYVIVGN
jgi:hypothetical protein